MNWRDWTTIRLQPPPASPAQGRDHALEALRGICALLVFCAHGFIPAPVVDPVYAPSEKFWWLNLGMPAVLMFFVLSGYVIGLTIREPFSGSGAVHYLSRRAMRLLPVTYAAIFLAWLFRPSTSLHALWGNFLFLQNIDSYPLVGWHFPLLDNNLALWTLNYEILYYLFFMVVWWRATPVIALIGLVALIPITRALGLPISVVIGRYACGACYWLSGLCIAWLTEAAPAESRRGYWPSALLAAYAVWHLGELQTLAYDTKFYALLDSTVVSLHRLDFLPVCVWCLLSITGRAPQVERKLAIGCLIWGWLGFVRTLWLDNREGFVVVTGAALLIASILMGWRWPVSGLKRMAPLGAVSFGLYALASPIQIAQRHLFPAFSGTPLTFALRLFFMLTVTIALAWMIDYRFNRWISAHFRK